MELLLVVHDKWKSGLGKHGAHTDSHGPDWPIQTKAHHEAHSYTCPLVHLGGNKSNK